jgi:hypothetical protein
VPPISRAYFPNDYHMHISTYQVVTFYYACNYFELPTPYVQWASSLSSKFQNGFGFRI